LKRKAGVIITTEFIPDLKVSERLVKLYDELFTGYLGEDGGHNVDNGSASSQLSSSHLKLENINN
jgi:hypothetical protein